MQERESLLPLSSSQRESVEEAVAKYEAALTAEAGQYLLGRGLSPEAISINRLGVVADPEPGHSWFRNFISIPYLDKDGLGLTLRFRCIEDHVHRDHGHGKYLGIPGDITRVYNIKAIHEAGEEIHVTEGEFDAMMLTQIGLPAVAIAGANGWKSHHRRMLAGFSRVWVWGDPDDAGAEFTNKVTRAMRSAKGVRLTDGDVTETFQKHGAEALYALIGQELPSEPEERERRN